MYFNTVVSYSSRRIGIIFTYILTHYKSLVSIIIKPLQITIRNEGIQCV